MKTITLRIPLVEAAMLQELQKTHKQFRNLEVVVLGLIRQELNLPRFQGQSVKSLHYTDRLTPHEPNDHAAPAPLHR